MCFNQELPENIVVVKIDRRDLILLPVILTIVGVATWLISDENNNSICKKFETPKDLEPRYLELKICFLILYWVGFPAACYWRRHDWANSFGCGFSNGFSNTSKCSVSLAIQIIMVFAGGWYMLASAIFGMSNIQDYKKECDTYNGLSRNIPLSLTNFMIVFIVWCLGVTTLVFWALWLSIWKCFNFCKTKKVMVEIV